MHDKSFQFEKNSFDLIRYFSAFSVMFLHYTYYAIMRSGVRLDFLGFIRKITEFLPGVIILFSLSGFLVSASFERCKSKKDFFLKRVFRLYPELWACTLVNLIVIVILAWEKLDGSIVLWLCTQVIGLANTPSCLKDFATGSVNGALWTIFTEVQLYLFLGISYNCLKKMKRIGWSTVLTGSALLNLLCKYLADNVGGVVSKIIERIFLPYLIWFLIGVFCYQKKEAIVPILKKYLWLLVLIFICNQRFNICEYGYYEDIVTSIILSLITIGLAYVLPAIRIKCDLSYGIFLYHWIVLNIMTYFNSFKILPWYVGGIVFVAVTLLMAWLSWYLIGKNVKKIIKVN